MIRRPIACPTHEVAAQSLLPGAVPPETAQALLAELVGPPAVGEAAPGPGSAIGAPAAISPPAEGIPFFPGGAPGGVPGVPVTLPPFVPGTPQPPDVTPPIVVPPVVFPPVVLPPEVFPPVVVVQPPDQPPPITGPGTPPDVFPPVVTPPVVTPPGPGGVPEPGVWALMLLGFGAIGAALRRRLRHAS